MNDREPVIHGAHLAKRFGASDALRDATVGVGAGEIVAILGPSGSGKSTLLHCLAGVLRPDAGQVTFDGRRIDRLPAGARARLRRERFGFVFQFGQLVPELSARENVMLPLVLGGARRRAARAEATVWLDRVGLAGLGDRPPGELSGGEAQRVAVARALIHRPRVVFADEPTGALDSLAGETVMELLTGAAREHGVAMLLVTHEPRIAAYAARELFVRDGATADVVAAA
jgi:putative ABC transport system ATP-binding protein